jgi:serine/threonine-protein kinase
MSIEIGQIVQDRYRIEALLGGGGQAAVYRAYDMRLEQTVAIKENTLAGPESLKQFKREALMLARIRHPNLPRVIDHFVTPDSAQYLVMDFIEGEDLAHIVARGPLPEDGAVAWISQACNAGISAQPAAGYHRHQTQNIRSHRGKVYLVVGIAKLGDAAGKTTRRNGNHMAIHLRNGTGWEG